MVEIVCIGESQGKVKEKEGTSGNRTWSSRSL